MAVSLHNATSEAGLQKLNDFLLSRSYITGYQASKDDLSVFAAISSFPSSEYANVSRWYNHIAVLLKLRICLDSGKGPSPPASTDKKAPADDDDVDLFGEETEEEKKAAVERAAAIKSSGWKVIGVVGCETMGIMG